MDNKIMGFNIIGDMGSKSIKANDNFIRKAGDIDVPWTHPIYELINNSIQAAEDRALSVDIEITLIYDDDAKRKINTIQIKDKSGGIDYQMIDKCLEPALRVSKATTLNEHGMGLNTAIEFFTQGNNPDTHYTLESYHKNGCFLINTPISYENQINIKEIEKQDYEGLCLTFYNVSDHINLDYPGAYHSETYQFWAEMCAKYRIKYNNFTSGYGKDFSIKIKQICGDKNSERIYKPIFPVLKNTVSGKNDVLTSFILEEEGYKVEFAIGAAHPDNEEYNVEIGLNKVDSKLHPYRICENKFGFDIVYQDVVISLLDQNIVPLASSLVGGNYTMYSAVRGQVKFLEGGKSFHVKSNIKTDKVLDSLSQKAIEIFKGERPHPKSGEKMNYISLISRNNLGRGNIASEDIIKTRMKESFEQDDFNPTIALREVGTDYGFIDMTLPELEVLIEVKARKSKPPDVLQVFKYLVSTKEYKKGFLYAPEHSDLSRSLCEQVNDLLKTREQVIELKTLKDTWTNPNLTQKEKEIFQKK